MSSQEVPLPQGGSPVEALFAAMRGEAYNPPRTLEEAKLEEHGLVALTGDWGGQVFATCPAKYVHCTEDDLAKLALHLEMGCWACNIEEVDGYAHGGEGYHFDVIPPGGRVAGGMGGGQVIDGLWVYNKRMIPLVSQALRLDSSVQCKHKRP